MGTSLKVSLDKSGIKDLRKKLQKLHKRELDWGFFEGFHSKAQMPYAELAAILEYGTDSIPPRPAFGSLVNSLEASHIAYEMDVTKPFKDYLERDMSDPYKIFEVSGEHLVDRHGDTMYNWLSSGTMNNDNAETTVGLKGFNMPFVESGELIESISYRVK